MSERLPRPAARAPRASASALQRRIRDICIASEGAMARSVCDRCAQDSPTLYCWRLGDSRLELDAPDRPAGPRDYDALRAAVSALLEGRPEAAVGALAASADSAAEPFTAVVAFETVADRVHAVRALTAARLRGGGSA